MSGPNVPVELLEELLLSSGPRLTPPEVVEQAEVNRETADRLWRAMGFPVVPDDDAALTPEDLDALRRVGALVESGVVDADAVVQVARTLGQAMARIAETVAGTVFEWLDDRDVEDAVEPLAGRLLPEVDALVVYLLHRHLVAAAARRLDAAEPGEQWLAQTIGFADVVGFTALTRELPPAAMQQLVNRFETVAADVVVDHGGRVVKTIGDEVMFATAEVVDGAAVAVDLAAAFAHEPDVPDVRVGLACGPVLSHHGDLYGPVVNLAARAVAAARPGTVLVSEDVAAALDGGEGRGGFVAKPLRRRKLKGLGTTPLHVLRPAAPS